MAGDRPEGTPGGGGEAPASVTVAWSFPGLVQTPMGDTFPTYLAHLFGKQPRHPLALHSVCATVANGGAAPARARLRVDLPVYAQPSIEDLTVGAGQSITACLDPTYDLTKLYALRETTPGRLEASLTEAAGGAELGAAMRPLSLAARDEIAWTAAGATPAQMRDLAAVFVTPRDPAVDRLQRQAQERSAWKSFGAGAAYQRPPVVVQDALGAGEYLYETVSLEAGERIGWQLLATTGPVDVYLFTGAQYQAWRISDPVEATSLWPAQITAGSGAITAGSAGSYFFVVAPASSSEATTVSYRRDATREDVASDVLAAVYGTLQQLGTRYSNIPDSYFRGWQHIRPPAEALQALAANCIDGSLLFASVLELLGMEPVIILTSAHAYVAVRSAPGSPLVWPVETTLLDAAPFAQAYRAGIEQLARDPRDDRQFQVLDIKALRLRGILPLPQ